MQVCIKRSICMLISFPDSVPKLAVALNSSDALVVAEACIAIRKILSIDRNPPIAKVLEAGILPRLRELLADALRPAVQLEACWSLTNIASGTPEQTQAVVESGAVPIFVQLLSSPDASLKEQAVWALANIAGDRPEYRDGCIAVGSVEALTAIVDESLRAKSTQMTRLGTWGLSNLCRGRPSPDFEKLRPCLASLGRALTVSNDSEVLADTAWALSYLTDTGDAEQVSAVLSYVDVARLVSLLAHPSTAVHTPVLRVVGNLVSGQSEITNQVVKRGALAQLKGLVLSNKKSVRKEALWAVSNICADSQPMLQAVIDSGAMDRVCDLLRDGRNDGDIRKEAAWTVCNACTVGNRQQVRTLVTDSRFRFLEILTSYLESSHDTKSIKTALEAVNAILTHGEDELTNPYAAMLEECGGLSVIEDLQQDESEEVYHAAVDILERFYNCDEEENTVPQQEKIVFDFGSQKSRDPKMPILPFARSG